MSIIHRAKNLLIPRKYRNDHIYIGTARMDDYHAAMNLMICFKMTMALEFEEDFKRCTFTSIPGAGSKEQLRERLKLAAEDFQHLIFTIGSEATIIARELFRELEIEQPLLFTDVRNPIRAGIIESYDQPERNIISFVDHDDHLKEFVDALLNIMPNINYVILPYNPSQEQGQLELDKMEVVVMLESRNVEVIPVPILNKSDLRACVNPVLKRKPAGVGVIMTLRDSLIMTIMPELADLATDYQLPMYAADPESVRYHTALGSGQDSITWAKFLAKNVHLVLKTEKRPYYVSSIPLKVPYLTYVNWINAGQQGLKLTSDGAAWLEKNAARFSL